MPDPVILRPEAGGEGIPRDAAEAETLKQVYGGTEVSPEGQAADVRRQAYRQTFDTLENKVLTLAEGVTDMVSLGVLRQTGEEADMRRDVNSGSAFVGNVIGALVPLPKSPLSIVTSAGERAGKAAAKALIRDTERSVIARGLTEAGAGAAVMGAQSLGHHVMESVLEDKDFAGEAILDEAKLGGVLGFAGGTLLGVLPKLARRADVRAQGGLLAADAEPVRYAFRDAVQAYDGIVDEHAARIGAIKGMRREGVLNGFADDILPQREEALARAQKARDALHEYDIGKVMNAEPGEYRGFQAARDEYFNAIDSLDRIMKPFAHEYAPVVELGQAQTVIDTPLGPRTPQDLNSPTMVDKLPAGAQVTPQSLERTGAQGPRARRAVENPTEVAETPAYHGATQVSEAEPTAIGEAPSVPQEAPPEVMAQMVPDLPERTVYDWKAGREMLPEHLDQITRGARVVHPTPDNLAAGDMLHGDFTNRPLLKLRNGWFFPPATIEANAKYFAGKFPEVLDRSLLEKAAPNTADTVVGGPALGYQAPRAVGGLAELNQVVDQLPVKGNAANTVVEQTPAAQLNAAMDAADRTRVDAKMGPRAAAAQRQAEKAAAAEARRMEASVRKAQNAAGKAGTVVEDTAPTVYDDPPDVKRAAAQKMLDDWLSAYQHRPSPGDVAGARVQAMMDNLYKLSGGRLDSAVAVKFAEGGGISPSEHPLGGRLDQVYALRRVGQLAVDEARGVKTALTDGLKKDIGALGVGMLAGSPLMALAARYVGFGARAAAAAGRLMQMTAGAAEKFLTVRRLRAVTWAAQNHAWAYSDKGPIKDPIARIEEIRHLAANPAAIAARVDQAAGDLTTVHPEFVDKIKVKVQVQLAALAAEAPQIQYDPLGRPMNPPAGEMRKFLEYENAIHNLQGILDSVAAGSASSCQIRALQNAWPSVHAKLVSDLLSNPDVVRRMERAKLRAAEALTGFPLTSASDPAFVQRQIEAWTPPQPPQPPGRPQAFKINPEGPATPAQSNARAPGN